MDSFNKAYLSLNSSRNSSSVLYDIKSELSFCEEFLFYVAFITNSGVTALQIVLDELLKKNIQGKVLTSTYLNFTDPYALKKILKYPNIDLRVMSSNNMHSKGYIFRNNDQYTSFIGSSNWTADALKSNTELNIIVKNSKDSYLTESLLDEFYFHFNKNKSITLDWINTYEKRYLKLPKVSPDIYEPKLEKITPNKMQKEALKNLKKLRIDGQNKALIISATGTGKTYLAAFDVEYFNPNKCLFIIHRENIARKSLESFKDILGKNKTYGLLSGNEKELDADFLFSTIQTISKDDYLHHFSKNYFDYIIIDETHRAGASSYEKILNYFEPKFLLGLTATPERTDGYDIFKHYNNNIAYEIRLQKALEANLLCSFHYFGISDIFVNNELLCDKLNFNNLVSEERVKHIIDSLDKYGCHDDCVRGLVFCSRVEEANELSRRFNEFGFKTVSLSGCNSEFERAKAISRLESKDKKDKLDYIFTVDIFNEGVDIPSINQVVMLRPTQSSIIFIQQLGRGLRKTSDEKYLTVIDFIGNYSNNFLIPIALFGESFFEKDTLRKLVHSGESLIPGSSTVQFDYISKQQIFKSIDQARFSLMKDLKSDYFYLKKKINRIPLMQDFIKYGERDPALYYKKPSRFKSYYEFIEFIEDFNSEEKSLCIDDNEFNSITLSQDYTTILKMYSQSVMNGTSIEEPLLLKKIIDNKKPLYINEILDFIKKEYKTTSSENRIKGAINCLNLTFFSKEKFYIDIIRIENDQITPNANLYKLLDNKNLLIFLNDLIEYAICKYRKKINKNFYCDNGFILYEKYSRRDVCKILNWPTNQESVMYGYKISKDEKNMPIFITYKKSDKIDNSIKYEDKLLSRSTMHWYTKHSRNFKSKDVKFLQNQTTAFLPLFVKKSDNEGEEFYFLGSVKPDQKSFKLEKTNENKDIISMDLNLEKTLDRNLFDYLTDL